MACQASIGPLAAQPGLGRPVIVGIEGAKRDG